MILDIATKSTGNTVSAAEFNQIVDAINAGGISVDVSQTATPNPTAFTFRKVLHTSFDPPEQMTDLLADIRTKEDWDLITAASLYGTNSSSYGGATYNFSLNASSGRYAWADCFLEGTNNALEVELGSYTVAAGNYWIHLAIKHATSGAIVKAGINLNTGGLAFHGQVSSGGDTTLTAQYSQISTTSAVVKKVMVVLSGNTLTVRVVHGDDSLSYGLFWCRSALIINNATDNGQWQPGVYAGNESAGTVTLPVKAFKVGRAIGKNMENHRMITTHEGRPYIKDGRVYFCATVNDSDFGFDGNTQFWGMGKVGIFSMNPQTGAYDYEGQLYFERGGEFWADGVACIVLDETTGKFIVVASSWSNNEASPTTWDLHLWWYETDQYILKGTHKVRGGVKLELDNTNYLQYDASLAKIGSEWHVFYTRKTAGGTSINQPYYAACHKSTDKTTWTLVGADTGAGGNYEGNTIVRIGGTYYGMTATQSTFRIHNVATMALTGTLAVPFTTSNFAPHPCFLQYMEDGETKYKTIMMDGRATYVHQVNETHTGYEWPIRNMIR